MDPQPKLAYSFSMTATGDIHERTSDTFSQALGPGRGGGAPPAAPIIPVPDGIEMLHSTDELAALAQRLGLRPDWHEPDEQNVSVRMVGAGFDNAMGPEFLKGRTEQELKDPMFELSVIIEHDGKPVAAVNLATLLAWGAAAGTVRKTPQAVSKDMCVVCGQPSADTLQTIQTKQGRVCRSCVKRFGSAANALNAKPAPTVPFGSAAAALNARPAPTVPQRNTTSKCSNCGKSLLVSAPRGGKCPSCKSAHHLSIITASKQARTKARKKP